VSEPVLSQIVLKTGILMNILEARVTATTGEMVVDVPIAEKQLDETISLFEEAGVAVNKIPATVKIDIDKCISCGACVSPCPVQAIKQHSDWSVELDEAKCIRCLLCIDACPVRAITST
jgi:ferredoxin